MKKKRIIIIISALIALFSLLSACRSYPSTSDPNSGSSTQDDISDQSASSVQEEKIRLLESRLALLTQNQEQAQKEYAQQIDILNKQIELLKSQLSDSSDTPGGSDTDTQTPTAPLFTYETENNSAIITGYTGSDEILVIPTSIDGYTVVGIADSAISSLTLREVIISSSVTKIGWFAFSQCPKLKSVTIPENVTKIGYDAFGSSDSSVIIYCYSGSFAHSYAQSYGLSFTLL